MNVPADLRASVKEQQMQSTPKPRCSLVHKASHDFIMYDKARGWCALPADLRPSTEALAERGARACAHGGHRAALVTYRGSVFTATPDKIVSLLDAFDAPAVGTALARRAARARTVTIAVALGPRGVALATFLIPSTEAPS